MDDAWRLMLPNHVQVEELSAELAAAREAEAGNMRPLGTLRSGLEAPMAQEQHAVALEVGSWAPAPALPSPVRL